MTYDAFDVVVVPFPFTDRNAIRRRPALVLSNRQALSEGVGHSVLAMITSADNPPWPLDVAIRGKRSAGLQAPSIVRMKLFTLDDQLILRKIGHLSNGDCDQVTEALNELLRS